MTPLVTIALYGWLPISLIIFRELRGHRGVIACYIAGTLLLPEHTINFSGLPDYSKAAAMAYGVFAGAVLFDPKSLFRFRPRWFDLFLLCFCLVPIPSALANNLSFMDGVNVTLSLSFGWGIPYLYGRIYLRSFESLRSAAYGIFLGGVFYIPLCLYEIRMSPQLNKMIYGFQYGSWSVVRYNGYRPNVFLRDGLDLGLWMTAATLCGYCLYRFRITRRVYGIKIEYIFLCLLATTILCKATGALLLLGTGMALMYLWQKTRWRTPILLLSLTPILYLGVRTTQAYDFSHVVEVAKSVFGPDRAQSLEFRLKNEDMLIGRALESPVLGWTGYGRNRVRNEDGKVLTITDGYWVIVMGTFGIVGLILFYSGLLTVPILCVLRFSSRRYALSEVGAAVALSLFTIILSIDCLLNAFWTSVYPLCLGGLSTIYMTKDSKLLETFNDDQNEVEVASQRRLWPPTGQSQQPQITS